jgi:transcription antitermination factor NusG
VSYSRLSATDSGLPWYALKVRTYGEIRVSEMLEQRDYSVYLPVSQETRQYSDRVKHATVALFPGYLFCNLDIKKRLPVLTVPGVQYFVSIDGEPARVPITELRELDAVLQSGFPVHPCDYLVEGDRVRVVVGSLRGVEGVLVRSKACGRLVVSVQLLQRSVAVEVDRDWLQPVSRQRIRIGFEPQVRQTGHCLARQAGTPFSG